LIYADDILSTIISISDDILRTFETRADITAVRYV